MSPLALLHGSSIVAKLMTQPGFAISILFIFLLIMVRVYLLVRYIALCKFF